MTIQPLILSLVLAEAKSGFGKILKRSKFDSFLSVIKEIVCDKYKLGLFYRVFTQD